MIIIVGNFFLRLSKTITRVFIIYKINFNVHPIAFKTLIILLFLIKVLNKKLILIEI